MKTQAYKEGGMKMSLLEVIFWNKIRL